MERPRIKKTTQKLDAPNGDLYLLRASTRKDIRIEKPGKIGRELIDAIDGTRTREQLIERFGGKEVGNVLAQLEELGVVEDAADDEKIDPDTRASGSTGSCATSAT